MRSYELAPHAHVCVTTHGAVFLDLTRDTYVGLDPVQSLNLSAFVEGWPLFAENACDHELDCDFAESLASRGLLVRGPASGRAATPPALPEPRSELIPWDVMPSDHIHTGHVLSFLRALLIALFLIRCRSFSAIAARFRRHREQSGNRFNIAEARRLVSAYHHIRTCVFSRLGRCLLDSVALREFLSIYGVDASWVIGVQLRPFSAHSWVQHEHWILNGSPTFVRAYTPILVV